MDSFYGGKQGISFVIKAKFDSVEQMNQCFQDADYKAVWYGEYCIIDTINKNDADNGRVFRRTLNTAGDTNDGCAEYIGQIVGPAGGTPNIELGGNDYVSETFDAFETLPTNSAIYYKTIENNTITNKYDLSASPAIFEANSVISAPTATGSEVQESDYHTITFKSGKSYITNVITPTGNPKAQGWYELNNKNYIPTEDNGVIEGKDYYINNAPALRYSWYNFREANADNEDDPGFAPAKIVIGFEIPYIYNEIVNINELDYFSTPTITVTSPNDFYNQYTLEIPRGIPGAYVTNIHRMTVSDIPSETTCYDFSTLSYSYNQSTKKTSYTATAHTFNGYTGSFWACEFVYPTGDPVSEDVQSPEYTTLLMYIGTIHEIEDIDLLSDGNLIVKFSDENNPSLLDAKIKWINGVKLKSNGKIEFTYNTYNTITNPSEFSPANPQEQGWYINNGTSISPSYVPATTTEVISGVTYYTPQSIETTDSIKWITGATIDTNIINPNTGEPNLNYGNLVITYNDNTTTISNIHLLQSLSLQGNIDADTQGVKDQKIKYTLSGLTDPISIGDEINYIQDLVLSKDNHILILFTGKTYVPTGTYADTAAVITDNDGVVWRRKNTGNVDVNCEDLNVPDVWYKDFGPIDILAAPIYDCIIPTAVDSSLIPAAIDSHTNPAIPKNYGNTVYVKNGENPTQIWAYLATGVSDNTLTYGWKKVSEMASSTYTRVNDNTDNFISHIQILTSTASSPTYSPTPVWS